MDNKMNIEMNVEMMDLYPLLEYKDLRIKRLRELIEELREEIKYNEEVIKNLKEDLKCLKRV